VQIVDYSHRREDGSVGTIPDSLIQAFKTRNGRTVYDGGGITPDVAAELPGYNKISYSIAARDLLRSYALTYFVAHDTIAPPETFRLADAEYDDFVQYLIDKDFNEQPDDFVQFKPELKKLLEEEICTLYYYQQGRLRNKLPRDEQVNKAIEVLSDHAAYRKILAN
jgi:carboxyl-terminal processing protease